ncbi:hypothetical protein HYQ45_007460 [Verticillium longisporum]|uniref:Uncharacterized protein n=1 Tax=Verticillium longisporum TaxID=100787 RepID=A0A8I2ZP73_VERLO|nr:hypothetical protein HYQ44_013001 [Verticillium longisporum]KAG7134585.1 hypothetical protein HYQ45_007460 [Verticillium longisporum]KAG7148505.1 hypothetical protein HYQ46_002633 [Verticillium longisporum]
MVYSIPLPHVIDFSLILDPPNPRNRRSHAGGFDPPLHLKVFRHRTYTSCRGPSTELDQLAGWAQEQTELPRNRQIGDPGLPFYRSDLHMAE